MLVATGFASSTGCVVPRLALLVRAQYTLPFTGFGSMSSGRSIFVGATLSAARRVSMSTSLTLIPLTNDFVSVVSGIHSPVPSYTPSLVPSPVKRAT